MGDDDEWPVAKMAPSTVDTATATITSLPEPSTREANSTANAAGIRENKARKTVRWESNECVVIVFGSLEQLNQEMM